MNKQIGAIFLVAGTAIGSGMIALPMVLSKLGLLFSTGLMLVIWALVYYTAIATTELNLQVGNGTQIGMLGKKFSGPFAGLLGSFSLIIMSYALVAVYIYGGSSITQSLIEHVTGTHYSFQNIAICYACLLAMLLALSIRWVDYANRVLFISLLVIFGALLFGLSISIDLDNIPLIQNEKGMSAWLIVIPVVFTSFGFQGSIHSIVKFCNCDKQMLRRAFLWGTIIPVVVYVAWTLSALSIVYNHNPKFYTQMVNGNVEVGALIKTLSQISHLHSLQTLCWWLSICAILTSALGVSLGLIDSWHGLLASAVSSDKKRHFAAVILTFIPSLYIAIAVPNAFIAVLSFAGMALAVIAIILPIYLLHKANFSNDKLFYSILKSRTLRMLALACGIAIVLSEVVNMIS